MYLANQLGNHLGRVRCLKMTLRLGTLQNLLKLGNSSLGALRALNIGGLRMLQQQKYTFGIGNFENETCWNPGRFGKVAFGTLKDFENLCRSVAQDPKLILLGT